MTETYHIPYIALSIVIAIIASYTVLDIVKRMTKSESKAKKIWHWAVTLMLGVGLCALLITLLLSPELRMGSIIEIVYSDRLGTAFLLLAFFIVLITLSTSIIHHRMVIRAAQWEETRYKSLFEYNPDGMFTLNREGILLRMNPALAHITGYAASELVNSSFLPLADSSEMEWIKRCFQQALDGVTQVFDTAFIRKDGRRREIQVKLVPMIRGKETLGLYGIIKDITESNQTIQALRESEERYKRLVKLSPIPMVVHQEGRIRFVNPAFTELVGASGHLELIGKSIVDFSPPEYVDMVKKRIDQLTAPGTFVPPAEERVVRLDGDVIDVEVTGISLTYGSEVAVLMMVHDITRRKNAEAALRKSEDNYRLIAENMMDLIAVVGADNHVKYASPSYGTVLGIPPQTYVGQAATYLVHPDEHHQVQQVLADVRTAKAPENIVLRKRNDLHQYFYFDTDILPIIESNGQVKDLLAVSRDITQRFMAEAALRESEEKYRLIADYSQDMIKLVDDDGIILYASPSHKTTLGFNEEELVGKHLGQWIHPDDSVVFMGRLTEAIQKGENFSMELRKLSKSGQWIWVETHGTVIFNETGKVKRMVLNSRNIMERRLYQEKLEQMAYQDPLTGLPNRRFVIQYLEQSIKEAERYQQMLAVILMDLDKFKMINDTLGHDAGDELLQQFARRIKSCLRESDMAARLGGDEFIVLLPKILHKDDAIQVAERIREAMLDPWNIGDQIIQTTSSMGISLYPEDGNRAKQLLKHADLALYKAKEKGRNNFQFF
ncbi:sensor domain-containing protein [Neobacillus muris]|uniref:sensor domain-containing protein n=1 Tax=Neobacillus muris TaxID=2941334 RepID=UPI00203ABD47|nr:PAS domain S-box protein [Neobacillus muris]